MTERYAFAVDRHLVPNVSIDGTVIWNQDHIETMNSSLTDTMNDSYATAEEDTQYLSVLDSTNEISLENLNITLTNPKLEVEETAETYITSEDIMEHATEEISENQVVVYTVEGSDELYGIQLAQDEDGNLQKYQFQFRKNNDGQLEAIPETIQLLPMEEVVQDEANVEVLEQDDEHPTGEMVTEAHSMHIFVQEDNSNEHILPDHNVLEEHEENEEQDNSTVLYEHEQIEEETVDIKPGILTLQNVKQEMQEIQEHQVEFNPNEAMEEETTQSYPENLVQEGVVNFQASTENDHEETDENHLIEYSEHLDQNSMTSEENSNLSETMNNRLHIEYADKMGEIEAEPVPDYVKESHTVDNENSENFEHVEVNPEMESAHSAEENTLESQEEVQEELEDYNNENHLNDSDVDDYHIVEGMHITGDVDAGSEVPVESAVSVEKHVSSSVNSTNILRHALKTNKEPRIKKDNRLYLYVVQHPEKENVDSLSLDMSNLCKPMKTNPRSILKSSHAMLQAKNSDKETIVHQEERINKRFARCKEAMQARIFHNFINKTTIPQAPIRKNRLPRKQKIKPVERMDEEIVVQEVMVSSNGFVEAIGGENFNKENLEVMEYVELTDSDDDYDPKRVSKKKKKHRRKKIEITISDDSDDSHESVIELDETDDEEQEVPKSPKNTSRDSGTNSSPTKRRRGRPPKNRKPSSSESQTKSESESPLKKIRVEASENSEKPEIPCPKCDKTFPSQNSLKTHLQHHNLQSSLRNALPEYKYKCDDCRNTFKNNFLLKKHTCSKPLSCAVCKKKFPDASSLSVHKRIHAKEQLIKSTATAQVSPKKLKAVPSTDAFKSPKKVNNLKCKTCGKLCSSMQNLNIHMKSHREYACATCSNKFVSQLLLEKHVRESCVKSPKSNRRSMRIRSESGIATEAPKIVKVPATCVKVSCDKCPLEFLTHKALFTHKVVKHGVDTPDKSILQKNASKKLHQERGVHGGVPATGKLKNAYAELRCQLDFTK